MDPSTIVDPVISRLKQKGKRMTDAGAGQAGDTNLDLKYFLSGTLVSNVVLDTSRIATDTFVYVATDSARSTAASTRTVIIEPVPRILTALSTEATSHRSIAPSSRKM